MHDDMSKYKCPRCRLHMQLDPESDYLVCSSGHVVDYKLYRLIRDIVEMAVEKVNEDMRKIIAPRKTVHPDGGVSIVIEGTSILDD